MKKYIIIGVVIIIIIIGASSLYLKKENDSTRFKKEYENVNNISENNKKYINLKIEKKNQIIYAKNDNIISLLTTKDRIIFLGSPKSNETRQVIPTLLKVAKESSIDKIYYYNTENLTENLTEKIKEILKSDEIVVPTVVLIKSGQVEQKHEKSVLSHKNEEKKLSNSEEAELYEVYEDLMIKYIMCTSNC